MSKLLAIKYGALKDEMDTVFDLEQEITSLDIFDAFVSAFSHATNVLEEDKLRAFIFNQFKSYGDHDKQMCEVAMNVSGIQQSTQDAISAIDSKDDSALKNAYTQLKDYQKRILELEEDMYTDEITGVYNRKYLINHELDADEQFKEDGVLLHLSINNFAEINKGHGQKAGDVVLKFVSKLLEKDLKAIGISLIRYMGVQFVALSEESTASKTEKIFTDTVSLVLGKKFKTHSGEILNIELQFNKQAFRKSESFTEVYKSL